MLRPIIGVDKIATPTCVNCGDPISYQLVVSNTGNITATTVVVTDLFEAQFEVKKPILTNPAVGMNNIYVDNNNMLTVTIPTLLVGSTVTITANGEIKCCNRSHRDKC